MQEVFDRFYATNSDILEEKRLLCAVLERAILDLFSEEKIKKQIRREALVWIRARANIENPPPWSFSWVCLELDLCPFTLRRTVLSIAKSKRLIKTTHKGNITAMERVLTDLHTGDYQSRLPDRGAYG